MKILNLKFSNLNSLYGNTEIDFTEKEYEYNGIYAIVGPTGAGKTTILDAICLALYRETPRLGIIANDGEGVMSEYAVTCSSELLVECNHKIYLFQWSQKRARKKNNGKISSKHEISEYSLATEEGTLLSDQFKKNQTLVTEITGMTFKRFTKSMLLAQGEFSVFLKAKDDDRAEILEQITETSVYSEISKLVYDKQKEEKDKLEKLKSSIEGIETFSEEDERMILLQIDHVEKDIKEIEVKEKELGEVYKWLVDKKVLNDELKELKVHQEKLATEIINFKSQEEKLNKATQALQAEGCYSKVIQTRKLKTDNTERLKILTQDLVISSKNYEKCELELKKYSEDLQELKTTIESERGVWKQVREIDSKIGNYQQQENDKRTNLEKIYDQLNKIGQDINGEEANKKNLDHKHKETQEYLETNKIHSQLESKLGEFRLKLKHYENKTNSINEDRQKYESIKDENQKVKLNEQKEQSKVFQKEIEKLENKKTTIQKNIDEKLDGKLMREYEAEKNHLQESYELRLKIKNYEEDRKKLVEEKPCFLCGSLEHPFATETIPKIDEVKEALTKIEKFIVEINQLSESVSAIESNILQAKTNLTESDSQSSILEEQLKNTQEGKNQLKLKIETASKDIEDMTLDLETELKPYGEFSLTDIPSIITDLSHKLNDWNAAINENTSYEDSVKEITLKLTKYNEQKEGSSQRKTEIESELNEINKKLKELNKLRFSKFEDKDVDLIENKKTELLRTMELQNKNKQDEFNNINTKLNELKGQVTSTEKVLGELENDLQNYITEFNRKLEEQQIGSEEQYLEFSLPNAEIDTLKKSKESLDSKKTALTTKISEREQKLSVLTSKEITTMTLDEVIEKRESLKGHLAEKNTNVGGLKQQIKANEQKKESQKEYKKKIDDQENEWSRWAKLNAIIGSHDGKNFRNFAQGITFDILIGHANEQLNKMSDRYILIQDPEKPLSFNIVDNYQGGILRPTDNLSGGECFILSLALALGLSKMVSKKMNVDSLFLDEGFGTLDEETLDKALDALSGLNQQGKIIGVISHVTGLKERITTQIKVDPLGGGKSKISGPGISWVK